MSPTARDAIEDAIETLEAAINKAWKENLRISNNSMPSSNPESDYEKANANIKVLEVFARRLIDLEERKIDEKAANSSALGALISAAEKAKEAADEIKVAVEKMEKANEVINKVTAAMEKLAGVLI